MQPEHQVAVGNRKPEFIFGQTQEDGIVQDTAPLIAQDAIFAVHRPDPRGVAGDHGVDERLGFGALHADLALDGAVEAQLAEGMKAGEAEDWFMAELSRVRPRDSAAGLELLRHDAAHVMAEAVQEIWPETQVTIGPAIENGFYYDVEMEHRITEEDLKTIETEMKTIIKSKLPIEKQVLTKQEAINFFKEQKQDLKIELINSFAEGEEARMMLMGLMHL